MLGENSFQLLVPETASILRFREAKMFWRVNLKKARKTVYFCMVCMVRPIMYQNRQDTKWKWADGYKQHRLSNNADF